MCDSMSCQHTKPTSRRNFLRATTALSLFATASFSGFIPAAMAAAPPKPENILTSDEAIKRLMEGNQRYVSGVRLRHNFAHDRAALTGGQNPYAAILGCADSRVAPEYTFDAARGDLFIARVAGNFANEDMLGSLEYGVAVLNIPVIVVLGHDRCGAVDAAVKAVTQGAQFPGHITSLVNAITPSVKQAQSQHPDSLLNAAIEQNVRDNVVSLAALSPIIEQAQQAGKLKIVGGIYRLDTGKVDFLA